MLNQIRDFRRNARKLIYGTKQHRTAIGRLNYSTSNYIHRGLINLATFMRMVEKMLNDYAEQEE